MAGLVSVVWMRESFPRLPSPATADANRGQQQQVRGKGEEKLSGTLTVDLHAGTIDFWDMEGRLILPGLVRIRGDRLQLCVSQERDERPATWTAAKGSGQSVTTLRRKR
jgi:hypothetical protein